MGCVQFSAGPVPFSPPLLGYLPKQRSEVTRLARCVTVLPTPPTCVRDNDSHFVGLMAASFPFLPSSDPFPSFPEGTYLRTGYPTGGSHLMMNFHIPPPSSPVFSLSGWYPIRFFQFAVVLPGDRLFWRSGGHRLKSTFENGFSYLCPLPRFPNHRFVPWRSATMISPPPLSSLPHFVVVRLACLFFFLLFCPSLGYQKYSASRCSRRRFG